MEAKLTFKYDRQGDILCINKITPYPEQESEELGERGHCQAQPENRGDRKSRGIVFLDPAPAQRFV